MNPDRYQKICDVFAEVSELPLEQRAAFLSEKCAGDENLRLEVESLLASNDESAGFIETPALEMAAEILADEETIAKRGLQIGHYRIVSLLGAGGMGEVWLADDVRLKRRIALKLLSAVHRQDLLRRFEQEACAASALNHPNIITIFDIGESLGWQFIATEYINGKTLRRLIEEKSLSVAQSIEIAVQICAALAAAHSAGIIHRDVKPENIMIRGDGIVKVLDFGLARFSAENTTHPNAKTITKPGMVMGTVTYMSPEQARGMPVDRRTDVFSLGIVLYEMLTGKQPFGGFNDIEVLAAILEREPAALPTSVPDELKNVVRRALDKNHLERPAAAELLDELRQLKRNLDYSDETGTFQPTGANPRKAKTAELTALTGGRARRKTDDAAAASVTNFGWSLRGKVAAVFLVLLAAVSGFGIYHFWAANNQPAVLGESDKLLIAEFVNKTGDEDFDEIFRQPLAVGLAQSPYVTLVPDGQIRQTLKQMERPATETLTDEIAREICQRRNVKAFLKGIIENHGVEYLITLEAFDAATGERVARAQVESENKETILDSLDAATDEMRERLGESLASIKRFDEPLKTSTTASLEALKLYSLATKVITEAKTDEAITLFKQAVEIDPDYASAYASLAAAYGNKGQMTLAAEYTAKAFEKRDRMIERDKQKITGFYYVFVTGEIEKDIENLEAAKLSYPRESVTPLNLGASYSQLGKFVKAEENARLAISLEPGLFFAHSNLGRYLSRQSRFAEAKVVYEEAASREFTSDQINSGLFTQAFALGDEAEMRRQLEILRGKDESKALMFEGNPQIFAGRAREYEKTMKRAVDEAAKDAPDTAADYAAQIATNLAALGKCPAAQIWAKRALEFDRGQQTLTDAAFTSALCKGQTETLIAELKEKFPKNTMVNSIWLPIIRARLEMDDAPERALETLEINRQFEGAAYFWDNYLRGKIYLKLGRGEQAAAEFEKILKNRGWAVQSPLYALSHLELARAFQLQNNTENARKYHERFAALWKNADADLPISRELIARR